MATIYERPGSPYYWLRFSHNGKRIQESTEIKVSEKDARRKAQKVADKRQQEEKSAGGYADLFKRMLRQVEQLSPQELLGRLPHPQPSQPEYLFLQILPMHHYIYRPFGRSGLPRP